MEKRELPFSFLSKFTQQSKSFPRFHISTSSDRLFFSLLCTIDVTLYYLLANTSELIRAARALSF